MGGQPWSELELHGGHGELAGEGIEGEGGGERGRHGEGEGCRRGAWGLDLLLRSVLRSVCEEEEKEEEEEREKKKKGRKRKEKKSKKGKFSKLEKFWGEK
jgi:hypothetical protein